MFGSENVNMFSPPEPTLGTLSEEPDAECLQTLSSSDSTLGNELGSSPKRRRIFINETLSGIATIYSHI
jgi:hypothetical protein